MHIHLLFPPSRVYKAEPLIKENYLLLPEASERLANNTAPATPMEDVMKELGISDEELAAAEDVVIE